MAHDGGAQTVPIRDQPRTTDEPHTRASTHGHAHIRELDRARARVRTHAHVLAHVSTPTRQGVEFLRGPAHAGAVRR